LHVVLDRSDDTRLQRLLESGRHLLARSNCVGGDAAGASFLRDVRF